MLDRLPAEIALQAISHLPLQSLRSVTRVSHDWNALVAANEPTVYRNAALLHRFIRCGPVDSIQVDWKAYCRRQLEIERGWRGRGPPIVRELTATGTPVHRIKVDYELGLVMTTFQTGGLLVCDIKSNRVLWALPSSHTVQYAHLEYDRGYIVFNRYDNCKEVWRRTVDTERGEPPETSPPDKKMLDASTQAAEAYDSPECHRGRFNAWALLRMPEHSRAFRLSYPTLLAVAANNAYLWDVTTSQLVSVIRDIQRRYHNLTLAAINYVEVNELYVFICGAEGLRIFARDSGALMYQLSTRELSSANWHVLPQTPGSASSIIRPQMLLHNHHPISIFHGEFMACHVSASGSDLAALTTTGRLVIFPGFQRLFTGSNAAHHRDIAVILDFQPFLGNEDISCYLAVGDRNGKLAVATRKGIYVISLDFDFMRMTADCPPAPGISVCRLSKFENERLLPDLSCLQITHDAIYFTYKPSQMGDPLEAAHHVTVHDAETHDPPDVEGTLDVDADDVMDDDPEEEWQDGDDDFDNGEMEVVIGGNDDHGHAIIQHLLLPSSSNTVYCVSF